MGGGHDVTLLRQICLENYLQACLTTNGRQCYLYGDAGYMLRPWLQTAFNRVGATREQEYFNSKMSVMRVNVEWS